MSMYEFETRKHPKRWSLVKSHPFYPIAATVSEDGILCVHDVELNITHSRQETSKILALTWHPRLKYLATGHQNSNISIWCIIDQDSCYRTIKTTCVDGISRLEWSRDGETLAAGTFDGKLILLRVNKRGHMQFMAQYQTTSEIIFLNVTSSTTEKTSRFLATDMNGGIYSLSENGCEKCVELKDGIALATFEEGIYHVLTTKLAYFKLGFDCNTQKLVSKGDKIQLEKRNQNGLRAAWIAAFGLVYCQQGSLPRIWVMETDEIMLLQSTLDDILFEFNPEMNILAVASADGRVGFWEMVIRQNNMVSWTFLKSVEVESDVVSMDWLLKNLLIVRTNEGAHAIEIRRSVLVVGTKDFQAVKIRSKAIKLIHGESTYTLECPGNVTSMQISGEYFVCHSGNVVSCYSVKYGPESIVLESKIDLELQIGWYVILSTSIVTASQTCLRVVNLASLESEIYYNQSSDGEIIRITGLKDKIFVVTSTHQLKKYIVDGTHLKLISTAQIPEMRMGPGFTVKANADGSLLSCYTNTRPTFFQIFDAEGSAVLDCLAGSSIQSMFWDAEDPRVFAIQIKDDTKIKAYFISPNQVIESKIILPATVPGELFGLLIPWMLFHSNDAITNEIILAYRGLIACKEKDLKSVTGVCLVLESSDGKSRRDLMRLLKNIEGEPTWLQLAQIFIEYSKYEMAKYCFGKIKNVKALRTITYQCEIGRNTNLKEQYRIHLGNYARAIEIPAKTNDFAQLSENFQSLALWDKAFNIAANSDISLLETTYYNFAMHLQERGDYGGAIAAFEKSNANAAEIPRMIMSHNGDLQSYLKSTDKIDAIIWWAQYAESHGDFDTALEYYRRANDVLSLARIYCITGEIQKATELSMAHPDSKSIFYLMAKYFERDGNHKDSIYYYIRSNCFSCGLRIALINRMDQEVLQLALQCSAFHMKEAANYFEECGQFDNAILLFTKAKAYNKAIQLCISTNNTSAIEKILENIEASGNHTLLALLQSMRRKENQENELYK